MACKISGIPIARCAAGTVKAEADSKAAEFSISTSTGINRELQTVTDMTGYKAEHKPLVGCKLLVGVTKEGAKALI